MNYQSIIELLLSNTFIPFAFQILAFCSIISLSLVLRANLGFSLSGALLSTFMILMNLLYWGTFIDFHLTRNLIIGAGIISLVKYRNILLNDRVRYLLLVTIALWFGGITYDTVPFSWDEFFWTLFTKHINSYSTYWDTNSGILITHIRYMPGAALWHNYFSLKDIYSEGTAYFAVSIMFLFFLNWFYDQLPVGKRLFGTLLVFFSIGAFSYAEGWFSLYVDPLVGITLGTALIAGTRYLYIPSKENGIIFILACSMGALIKESGITAMISLIPLALLSLFVKDWRRAPWLLITICIFYCASIVVSWKTYQAHISAQNPDLLKLMLDHSESAVSLRMNILKDYLKFVLGGHYMMACLWIMSISASIFLRHQSNSALSIGLLASMILAFLGLYLIGFLYLVGGGLPGIHRYMSGLLLAVFALLVVVAYRNNTKNRMLDLVLILPILWMPINMLSERLTPSGLFMLVTPHPKQVPLAKIKIAEIAKNIPASISDMCRRKPAKVWYVHQQSIGYEAMIARHILAPCQVSPGSFSLGPRYHPDDIFTANYSVEDFKSMAATYPFMVIGRVDDQLIREYGNLFSTRPAEGVLYKFDSALSQFKTYSVESGTLSR